MCQPHSRVERDRGCVLMQATQPALCRALDMAEGYFCAVAADAFDRDIR
jgi:hypothetical protein